jgi:hypothetical protein
MAHSRNFKPRSPWIFFLCGVPFLAGAALAQSTLPPAPAGNEEALKAWAAASGSQTVPIVAKAEDGSSKLEWHSTLAADAYNNDITPPPAPPGSPPTATPLNTGNFAKAVLATDIRLIEPGGQVNFMQFGLTASNDRSVVSRYQNQLNSLQIGRTGTGYQIGAGDASVSFSQLGSTLGLRGLNMQRQLGDWTFSGYGGVVSESWEALYNRAPLDNGPARSRFVRNVVGTKIEYAVVQGLKAYATMQGYNDNVDSLDAARISQQPSQARALSTGLAYQDGPWTVTSELALSRFDERYQLSRKGDAALLDAIYRQTAWSLRSGVHIDPKFVSLSQAVPPGVKEWYAGGDWTAATWISLGTDYRHAASRTAGIVLLAPPADPTLPPPFPIQASSTLTRSLTSRANINFGSEFPGLALSLSNTINRGEDAQQHESRNQNNNAAFSYASPTWTGSLGYTLGKLANSSNPQGDSRTSGVQAQLGRNYSGTVIPWSFGWSLTAGEQTQKLLFTGTQTKSRTHGLSLNGQRSDWAQFTLAYQGSSVSQTTGGPDLATHSLQFEVVKKFGEQNSLKAYIRESQRNVGDIALRTDERAFGMQLNLGW